VGTSFKDMPKPLLEIVEYEDRYHVIKRYWNGSQVFISEHFNSQEAEGIKKLLESSDA